MRTHRQLFWLATLAALALFAALAATVGGARTDRASAAQLQQREPPECEWVLLARGGTRVVRGHALVSLPGVGVLAHGGMASGGGGGAHIRDDVRTLDLTGKLPGTWQTVKADAASPLDDPGGLSGHAAALRVRRDKPHELVVHGDYVDEFTAGRDETYRLTLDSADPTWNRITLARPPQSADDYAAYLAHDDSMVIYAVFGSNRELWSLTLGGTPTWTRSRVVPERVLYRYDHMVHDRAGKRLLFLSQRFDIGVLDVSRGWAAATWQEVVTEGSKPSVHFVGSPIYMQHLDWLVFIGGHEGSIANTWALDLGATPPSWSQLRPSGSRPPSPYFGGEATYSDVGRYAVIDNGQYTRGLRCERDGDQATPTVTPTTHGITTTPTASPTVTPTSMPGPPQLIEPEDGAVLPQPIPPSGWDFRWAARMGPCSTTHKLVSPLGVVRTVGPINPSGGYEYRYRQSRPIPDSALTPWTWSVTVNCPMGSNVSETRTFSVLSASVTPTATSTSPPRPTPTATCDTHTVETELVSPKTEIAVGETVTVTARIRNVGCSGVGLPQFRLRIPDESEHLVEALTPLVVMQTTGVGRDWVDAEFALRGLDEGTVSLSSDISFEVHLGYPGPAYWGSAGAGPLELTIRESAYVVFLPVNWQE